MGYETAEKSIRTPIDRPSGPVSSLDCPSSHRTLDPSAFFALLAAEKDFPRLFAKATGHSRSKELEPYARKCDEGRVNEIEMQARDSEM